MNMIARDRVSRDIDREHGGELLQALDAPPAPVFEVAAHGFVILIRDAWTRSSHPSCALA
jgi:hypothetical protein